MNAGETIRVTIEATVEESYRCAECDAVEPEALDAPLYECGVCGSIFNATDTESGNNRCPDCGRFGTKLASVCCMACGQGEVEAILTVTCPICNETVEADTFEAHLMGGC